METSTAARVHQAELQSHPAGQVFVVRDWFEVAGPLGKFMSLQYHRLVVFGDVQCRGGVNKKKASGDNQHDDRKPDQSKY